MAPVSTLPRSGGRDRSAALNETCACSSLDRAAFLDAAPQIAVSGDHAHLASDSAVFLAEDDRAAMLAAISAIEAAVRLPQFQETALRTPHAAKDFGPAGAFMGYDFHLTPSGPKLIEINTNAGGALIGAHIFNAHRACCAEIAPLFPPFDLCGFETAVFEMFMNEWRRQRGEAPLARIAIVDDEPEAQYLYPEFLLAKDLFERRGVAAVIADASAITYEDGRLLANGHPVDLVYNRLVDFQLAEPRHAALSRAYADGAVVVTPNPRHHALYADKRNLVLLSDPDFIGGLGLNTAQVEALNVLPRAENVSAANAERLWTNRKRYYFKPACGHGSKAVYRGEKLTTRVWADILKGDYIAQEAAAPSERIVGGAGGRALKQDIRFYAYEGRPLLKAARLYQGQTTNFRTPGGGFAPVFIV